jgi:hypothetical protein
VYLQITDYYVGNLVPLGRQALKYSLVAEAVGGPTSDLVASVIDESLWDDWADREEYRCLFIFQ